MQGDSFRDAKSRPVIGSNDEIIQGGLVPGFWIIHQTRSHTRKRRNGSTNSNEWLMKFSPTTPASSWNSARVFLKNFSIGVVWADEDLHQLIVFSISAVAY
jgi:hypothetical protein